VRYSVRRSSMSLRTATCRDLASCRTCCRMQLRAATKPTDANFVRVIRQKGSSIKVVTTDSIGTCSSGLYYLPFETLGTASCGTTGILRSSVVV